MKKEHFETIIIGGGPAGLQAALSAAEGGGTTLIIEREEKLGGILKQCIHDGFGVLRFKQKWSGPEYAGLYIDEVLKNELITVKTLNFVVDIFKKDGIFNIKTTSSLGMRLYTSKFLVLANGCRERTARQVNIHGTRPAGVLTAGAAQYYVNILGALPGKTFVILGSGDVGLIMARRLTLEGAKVLGVYEVMSKPSGLVRNIHQCLNDFGIPLHLNTTVTKVFGDRRVEAVEVCKVDEKFNPIAGHEQIIPCDSLILSVGLIPENELAEKLGVVMDPKTKGPVVDENGMTSLENCFSVGNAHHVHDLVDDVSDSAEITGNFIAGVSKKAAKKRIHEETEYKGSGAFGQEIVCTTCPLSCIMRAEIVDGKLRAEGQNCNRGLRYAELELTTPMRTLTSTVKTIFKNIPLAPVRTENEIPKNKLFEVMEILKTITIEKEMKIGDVLIENILDTGVNLILTTHVNANA
jgi:CxxC motif-containing protein/thioredoxin reductase